MFSTAKVFIWCVLFPCVPNETLNISFKQINTSYQVLSLSLSWTKWCSYWFSFDRNSPHVHSCECYLGTMMKSSQILFWRFLNRRFFHVCERMWWQLKIIKDCLHMWRVYLRRDSFHVVKGNGEVKGFFTTSHIQVESFSRALSCLLHDLGLQKASPHHRQSQACFPFMDFREL